MFEDALLESNHRIKTHSRYWSLLAILINSVALIALVIWPLLHPEALPTQMMPSLLVAPPPPTTPPPPAPPVKVQVQSRSLEREIEAPSRLPHRTTMVTDPGQTNVVAMTTGQEINDSSQSGSFVGLFDGVGNGRTVMQAAPHPASARVTSSVMAGYLLQKTLPPYPVIAREARIQGTVVLQATISKAGEIENLRVVSGPPMLRQAALDAVRLWRYKPFILNGDPVVVETTVNVVFSLGN